MTSALLVTSNGAGMGHLSRQLSVALAARPDDRTALLSLSLALPQVLPLGVPGEYCASYERDVVPRYFWNRYFRTRLVALSGEIGADALMFDGVAPYRGLLATRELRPDVAFIWMRRGMWLEGRGDGHLRKSAWFDAIIEPGDLGIMADRGETRDRTDAVRIPPVSMLEVVPRVPRAEAAAALGLEPDRPTILVTLGTGRLGDASTPGRVVLDTLLSETRWQIAVTKAGIAKAGIDIPDPGRVVEVRGVYPLVRYLAAFDAVVSAAGYNAVHEFVSAGLPTLLIPNRSTMTDDQVGRARGVAERELALTAAEDDVDAIVAGTRSLLNETVRERIHSAIEAVPTAERQGGASAAWHHIERTVARHSPSLADRLRARWSAVDDAARTAFMRTIGQERTDAIRRALRRSAPGGIPSPLEVVVTDDLSSVPVGSRPLLFSDEIRLDDIRSGHVIEHMIAGAGPEYRAVRRAIIERNYRVVENR